MFSTTFPGGLRLVVKKASILKLDVDAIVNAANEHMAHGAGVARVSTVYFTSGYKMYFRWIENNLYELIYITMDRLF